MPITLPTAPTPAEVVDPCILLLYGPPKCGKGNVLAELSRLTGACCVDMEWPDGEGRGGYKYETCVKVRVNTAAEFEELCNLCVAERRAGRAPYPITIFDHLGRMEEWAIERSTARYAATPQGQGMRRSGKWDGECILTVPGKDDTTGGAGWGYLRADLTYYLRRTLATADKVIWVAHLRETKAVAEKNERMADSKDIALIGQGRVQAAAAADATGYVCRDSANRLMASFATKDNKACGCRAAHLAGADFALSEWVPAGPATNGKPAPLKLAYHWERVYRGLAGMRAAPPPTTPP